MERTNMRAMHQYINIYETCCTKAMYTQPANRDIKTRHHRNILAFISRIRSYSRKRRSKLLNNIDFAKFTFSSNIAADSQFVVWEATSSFSTRKILSMQRKPYGAQILEWFNRIFANSEFQRRLASRILQRTMMRTIFKKIQKHLVATSSHHFCSLVKRTISDGFKFK